MPLINGHYPVKNPQWLVEGMSPTNVRCSLPDGRHDATSDLAALASGVMTAVALPLQDGDVVTNLTFVSGATALGTGTHWWFALYDTSATPVLIAQTADQVAAAWAANTVKTLALSTPYLVPASGLYYAAVMVAATTPPSLAGRLLENAAAAGAVIAGMKVLAQTSGSALAAAAPGTIASPTTVGNIPLCYAS